jgi:PAS domain S-box-containing protein
MLGSRFKSCRTSLGQIYGGWTARSELSKIERDIVLYGGSVAVVGIAFVIASALQHLSVRPPIILIYLPATALSFWYGRQRSGMLAFAISMICLFYNFFSAEHRWSHVILYDAPIICLYIMYVWGIQNFAKSRHRLECVLQRNRQELEAAVDARTQELTRINAEYKAILDAAPFGIVLFGRDRIVERCNPTYERMTGYGYGELLGLAAPIPEEEREAWAKLEDALRTGERIVGHEAMRVRRDGSKFSVTLWMTPLQDARGDYRGQVGFILDNTDRDADEAARQMLTTLVEHSPDLVAVTDETGRLKFMNGTGRHVLGLGEGIDLEEINLLDRLLEGQQKNDDMRLRFPLREGEHVDLPVLTQNPRTGEMIHLCCASFTIPPPKGGSPMLLAFVAQDVTKRKEAETRLKLSLQENRRLLEENKVLQERLQHENISLQERNLALQNEIADIQRTKFEKIIGESPEIRQTLSKINQVASTDVTVLITGETGTGKELIAQAIHENSKRAEMPFRAINCAALPVTLMASELFGHERGAFTGADRQRLGQFELASGGTLFLDEIGELPLETQAMLLRVLEERNFERLGGTKLIRADVRVIVATNRDLHTAVHRGEFRQDLYFRLNGFRIEVPPLRDRKEDIPLLVQHFVSASSTRHAKNIRRIEKRAMEMLLTYGWPGNIRELRNVIDTSVIVSPGESLVVDEELLFGVQPFGNAAIGSLKEKLEHYERSLIERALAETHGRVAGSSGAANVLGMPPSTLSTRLQVLKIDPLKFRTQS